MIEIKGVKILINSY